MQKVSLAQQQHDWSCQRWANCWLMVGAMMGYSRFNVGLWLAQRWMMVDRQRCGECRPNEQNTVGPTAA